MASDVDSVGELYQTELNYKQKWVINNFGASCKCVKSKIISPVFCTPNEFVDLEWRMSLYPRGKIPDETKENYLSLYIESLNDMKLTATIVLSILNVKGEKVIEKTLLNKVFQPTVKSFGYRHFIDRNYVLDESNGIYVNDTLTVLCEITLDANLCEEEFTTEDEDDESQIEELKRRLKEFDDFERLFESGEFSDVIFTADGEKLPVHKSILSTRSPVFKAMFNHNVLEKHQPVIDLKDIRYKALKELFRFMYSGKVNDLDEIAIDLLIAAEKYHLNSLKDICEKHLYSDISTNNAVEYLKLADTYNATQLKSKTIDFIASHSEEIIDSQDLQLLGDLHRNVISELFRATVKKKSKSK